MTLLLTPAEHPQTDFSSQSTLWRLSCHICWHFCLTIVRPPILATHYTTLCPWWPGGNFLCLVMSSHFSFLCICTTDVANLMVSSVCIIPDLPLFILLSLRLFMLPCNGCLSLLVTYGCLGLCQCKSRFHSFKSTNVSLHFAGGILCTNQDKLHPFILDSF